MRGSDSYKSEDTNKAIQRSNKPKYTPFRTLKLGRSFFVVAFLILMFSLFACVDNSGIYRGKLSDNADALSKVYKDDINALKSYVEKDDKEAYDKAVAAKDDLYKIFKEFAEIKPSKRFKDKQGEIDNVIQPVLTSLDNLKTAMDGFKSNGDIDPYEKAFESNFKTMNEAVEKLNTIFETMKEPKTDKK